MHVLHYNLFDQNFFVVASFHLHVYIYVTRHLSVSTVDGLLFRQELLYINDVLAGLSKQFPPSCSKEYSQL